MTDTAAAGEPLGSRSDLVTDYAVADAGLDVAWARREHGAARYLLLQDADTVVGIVATAELRDLDPGGAVPLAAVIHPAVHLDAALSLAAFLADRAVTLLELDDGLPGLLVTAGGAPLGVLPMEFVDAYAATGAVPPPDRPLGVVDGGADELDGVESTPLARVRCQFCQTVNVLYYYDRRQPPQCENATPPHPLHVSRKD